MKHRNPDHSHGGLTRRQVLGLATLTGAGLAAASMGTPEASAATAGNPADAQTENFPPPEDFTYDWSI